MNDVSVAASGFLVPETLTPPWEVRGENRWLVKVREGETWVEEQTKQVWFGVDYGTLIPRASDLSLPVSGCTDHLPWERGTLLPDLLSQRLSLLDSQTSVLNRR